LERSLSSMIIDQRGLILPGRDAFVAAALAALM